MTHAFDEITAERLRASNGKKWVEHGSATGAWIAEMDFGTAPAVQATLRRTVETGEGLGYLPTRSLAALQRSFAGFVAARYDWHPAPEDVRPIADVLSGLQAAVRLTSRPASPLILPTPAYMPFLTLPGALDREVIQVPLVRQRHRYVYDLEALDAAFAAGGHLLVLCNPHNPVGRVLERDELLAISEVVERHGGRVFADEIHAPLTYPGHRHVPYASISPAAAAHAITAMSASKAFNLPGLKCAQLVLSSDADREAWERGGHPYEDQASTLGALAATAAYAEGGDWLDDVIDYLDGNRRALAGLVAEHLPGVLASELEGTYLAWLDFTATAIEAPAPFFRRHADVAATAGALCGDAGRGFLRFNIGLPRPLLVQAITRMGAALAEAR
ncbi:MalY/PatB family protein [Pseudactinotalea suaedae]|uniref:MalY/PatB family protein n=1 Tax=Pseudactinotalea suaedae TaxID=1524924 RepID=UPI0012E12DC6|nr:aminotransferase class I/II-fold pyridoxal phosphate-dependent enzyme [Pseudactinotalea suaedae]